MTRTRCSTTDPDVRDRCRSWTDVWFDNETPQKRHRRWRRLPADDSFELREAIAMAAGNVLGSVQDFVAEHLRSPCAPGSAIPERPGPTGCECGMGWGSPPAS